MEPNYTIIGTDGKHYGPVGLEQLKAWVAEGRVLPETKVMRRDTNSWLPAAQYAELGLNFAPAAPVAAASPPPFAAARPVAGNPVLNARVRAGADWFFWIAGLSLVNSLIALAGKGGGGFIVGLGTTLLADGVASGMGSNGKTVALVFDLLAAGILVLFGVFARKGHSWSFILGLICYGLDAGLCLVLGIWLFAAFHAYALFWIFTGFRANLALRALERGQAQA